MIVGVIQVVMGEENLEEMHPKGKPGYRPARSSLVETGQEAGPLSCQVLKEAFAL